MLRRRLGMSRDEFFNTYFTGQKELDVMAAMAPSERAQFLSRVLGYERLRVAQRLVKEKSRIVAAEAAGLRAALPDAANVERMHADATARLAQARERTRMSEARRERALTGMSEIVPRWLVAQQEREQLQEALAELRVVESEAAAYARDEERIGRELAAVLAADEELQRLAEELAPLARLSEELHAQDQLARDEGRRNALLDTERALEEEVRRLRERRTKIETAPTLEEEATLELEQMRAMLELMEGELEAKRTEWVRDRQEVETKRSALREQYAEVKEHRERLVAAGEDGECPTCERPLHDHYRTVLDHLDEQMDNLVADGSTSTRASSSSRRCLARCASSTSGAARRSTTSGSSSDDSRRYSWQCRSSRVSRATFTPGNCGTSRCARIAKPSRAATMRYATRRFARSSTASARSTHARHGSPR